MKWTENFVWEQVGKILPGLKQAKDNNVNMNLPRCIESCAYWAWLHAEDIDFKLDFEKQVAAYIIRVAGLELEEKGFYEFGKQEFF